MKTYTEDEMLALRDSHEAWLMAQPGVTGTSVGLEPGAQIVLRIFTKGIKQATRQSISTQLADVPIAWEEGEIVAQ